MAEKKVTKKVTAAKTKKPRARKGEPKGLVPHVDRSTTVRDRLMEIRVVVDRTYVEFAQLLYEAWANSYYLKWDYESFKDYAEKELGIKHRKARYLVSIADTVKSLGLEWEDVSNVGWTTFRELIPVLTRTNAKEWIDKAEITSRRDLSKEVRELQVSNRSPSDSVTLRFILSGEEASIIMSALDKSKEVTGNDASTIALEHICYEWFAGLGDSPAQMELDDILSWVKRSYGVELVPQEGQDLTNMVSEKDE